MMRHLCDGSLFSSIDSVVTMPLQFSESSLHQLNDAFQLPGIHQLTFDTKEHSIEVLSKILPLYASVHPPIGFIAREELKDDMDAIFFDRYAECNLLFLDLPPLELTPDLSKKLLDLHTQNGISLILLSYLS